MKTIGLIGGTSWISTIDYYKCINQLVSKKLGKNHSAKIILYSVDFEEYTQAAQAGKWDEITHKYIGISKKIIQAGAECILLGANTTHIIADDLIPHLSVPLISIIDATAKSILEKGQSKVGILGTRFTMEKPFYKNKLINTYHIDPIIPESDDRNFIHDSIFNELGRGIFLPETKSRYLRIMQDLKDQGAEGIVYACTEIPLMITDDECPVTAYNTIELHAKAAMEFALN